jgi:hypothetical protein
VELKLNDDSSNRPVVKKRLAIASPVLAPSVQNLLDDALSVVSYEIIRLKQKVLHNPTTGLDLKESRILQGYVKSLVELSREERERASDADLANMSDDELLSLVENLKRRRQLGAKNEQDKD